MPAVIETLDSLLSSRLDAVFSQKQRELLATPEEKAAPPPRKFVGLTNHLYGQVFGIANQWKTREIQKNASCKQLMPLADMLSDPIANQMYEPLSTGYQIARQIDIDTNGFQKTPTDFQRDLIQLMKQLLGRRMFGLEWKTNQNAIRKKLHWIQELFGIGGIMTGRKEGKSTGLALGTDLALMNIPEIEIALFSKTKKQAQIILNMAKVLLSTHVRRDEFIIEKTADTITLTNLANRTDIRKVTAYSGDADTGASFAGRCAAR